MSTSGYMLDGLGADVLLRGTRIGMRTAFAVATRLPLTVRVEDLEGADML